MAKDDRIVKLYDLSQEDIVRLVFSLLTKQVKVSDFNENGCLSLQFIPG